MVTIGNYFKYSLTIGSSKKENKSKEENEFESEDDLDELEVLLARRLSRGKGKYKGKLPQICSKCNEIGQSAPKCPNKGKSDRNEKKYYKYNKNSDYKDKGKKSFYIIEEDHAESSTD